MFDVKKYKFGFDIWGLVLFLIIMLPNFIWFALPAGNDILRNESITPVVDTIASVFQVVMVVSLCIIINKQSQKLLNKALFTGIIVTVVLYYIGWCMYYAEIVGAVTILVLCIAPCVAFIFINRQPL
jgi:hypothetical protein